METGNALQYLSQEELNTYQEMFSIFDKEDSGTMPTKDIPTFVRALGHCPTQAELRKMVENLDPQEEGTVTFNLIVSALTQRKKQNIEEQLLEALEGIQNQMGNPSVDGPNFLPIHAIKRIFSQMGEVLNEQQVQQFLEFLQENKLKEDKNLNFRDLCRILSYGYMQ